MFALTKAAATTAAILLFPIICAAQQPTPPTKRYPWDMRPKKCFMDPKEFPAVLSDPGCKNRDWDDFEQAKRNFGSLIGPTTDFQMLERAVNEIGFSRAKFRTGEYVFEAAYLPLDVALGRVVEHVPAVAEKFVDDWSRAAGTEGYATLARAILQYHEAWRARGSGYANTVTPEGWKLFHAKLAEADATLDSASAKLKETGPWHELKLRIAFLLPQLKGDLVKLVETATNAWPDYVALYGVSMSYMHPRWGGSYELMEGVAQMALEKTRAQHGAAIYALVYEAQFGFDCDCTLADSKVDWPTMKQGFRDIEARKSVSIDLLKHHAKMACQMRDKDEARRLYAEYDKWRSALNAKMNWPNPPEQPDDCRLFASR